MAYSSPSSNPARAIGFGVVVLIHVLVFWAFQNGLAMRVIDTMTGPIQAKVIEEIKPEKEEPPPPPPKFTAPPPPTVIMPEINIEAPPAPSDTAITAAPARQAAAPVAVAQNVTVAPRSNPRRPITQPEYPPTSKRLGEVGTVVLLLTVSEDGKVTDAKVDKSSGYDRLDQAAVQEALHSWKLLPGTVNGKPTAMQVPMKVTFRITD